MKKEFFMKSKASLMLGATMFIFGTIGIFRKYIPMPSATLASARGIVGMLFLLAFVLIKGQRPSGRAIRSNLALLLLSGTCIGFNWILLFEAYRYTTVAVATLCYYMAPIFVILISPLILKEKLTLKKLICVVAALVGMLLVSGVLKTGFTGLTGILLGLGAAALYATVILTNKFIRNINAYDKTMVQLGTAGIVLIPYILLTGESGFTGLTAGSVLLILFVCIVHTGVAYAMYFGSMEHLPAQTIALFSYIDPIVAIILSALLLHEPMGLMEGIGAILVLCATVVSEL